MRLLAAAVLVPALALSTAARAGGPDASVPQVPTAADLLARDFRVVPKMSDLPESGRHALGLFLGNAPIADAGEPWNATDALTAGLPRYRARLAGYAAEAAFVAYEHGGRGWSSGVVLMSPKAGVLTVTYACSLDAHGKLDLPRMRALARDCRVAGEHEPDKVSRSTRKKR